MALLVMLLLAAPPQTATPRASTSVRAYREQASRAPSSVTLEMRPVELRLASGDTVTVQRGELRVPIVRAEPSSKPITVDV